MSNTSSLIITAINIRSAGSLDTRTNERHGGIYYPESTKNNKKISAHWEAICMVNHLGYTDEQGVYHEPANIPLRITAWNSRTAAPGKGLADIFAKCVSVGKEFSASLRLRSFLKRHYVDRVPQVDHKGNPTMVPSYGWAIKSDLNWGSDSAATIRKEIGNYQTNPQSGFNRRPPSWNDEGTAANDAWKKIVQERMAVIYQGEPTYGYARVMMQEGAQMTNQAVPAGQIIQPQIQLQTQPQQFVNAQGQLVNAQGQLLNVTNQPIQQQVQKFVNAQGQPVNAQGQLLDANEQVIQTVQQVQPTQIDLPPAPLVGNAPTTAANNMAPGAFSAGEAPI